MRGGKGGWLRQMVEVLQASLERILAVGFVLAEGFIPDGSFILAVGFYCSCRVYLAVGFIK